MINLPVLVLNQSYEPLNICRVRRAIVLLYHGKAEMLENGSGFIQSASYTCPIPSVIRLAYMIRRPRPQPKLTRAEVFNRDRYTCQYCGKESRQLTLDHVTPRYRGGEHVWENLVSACIPCNRHKAGRTPSEAGMKLSHHPSPPPVSFFSYIPHHHLQIRSEWQKYLPGKRSYNDTSSELSSTL
ncbi:HNH endonuclease [Chloroflexota bacterium]